MTETKFATQLIDHAEQRRAAAQELIQIIHANENAIQVVLVDDLFSKNPSDSFWQEIRNDSVANQKCRPWLGDTNHFHIQFKK